MFSKVFILLLVVGLLFAVAPTKQAQAQTPTTLNVADWSETVPVGVTGRPTVLLDGANYHLWYGPDDTTLYHTVSTDPAVFSAGALVTFSGRTPFEVASTAIFKEGTTFYMVAYGPTNQTFDLYSSPDGAAWTFVKEIFTAVGMPDLNKIDAPFVFNDDGTYKLYFQKKKGTTLSYDIFLATSATVDGTYTLANGGTAVFSPTTAAWDGVDVMHPWVVKDGTTYYMWYSGYGGAGNPQRIGFATSPDGINWTKSPANPIIGPVGEPSVIKNGATWQMWYLGAGSAVQYVSATGPFEFQTIQAAIDAAADGDVIEVGPGTYAENVVINKTNLTLQSAGTATETIIDAPTGVGISVLKELGTVTVDGFTVEGWTTAGISQSWTQRAGTTFIVKNNIVNGTGDEVHGNCIQVTGDDSLVEGNVVDGAYYTGTGEYGASGILVYLANNAIVRYNVVTNADIGIAVTGGGAYGQSSMTGALVIDNEVSLSEIGISVSFDANNTTIKDNFVHDNELGLLEEYNWGYGPTGTVALHNKIVDNTKQALTESFDETTPIPSGHIFMAEANWWGSIAGPGETEINEYVDYAPWCANAACTEFLPGAVTIAQVDPVVCGNTTTTTIDINVAGIPTSTPLQGYQFRLHFDTAKTSVAIPATDIVNGGFIADGGIFFTKWIDAGGNVSTEPTGIIEVIYSQIYPATSTGSGKLASITLTHVGVPGDIDFTLTDVLLSSTPETDAQPIPVEVSTTPVVLTLNPAVLNVTKNPVVGYCTLAEAVTGAEAGDRLQLQADITIPTTVSINKSLTLDLNGKVATYSPTENTFALNVDGATTTLTLIDGISPSTGKILVVDGDTDAAKDGRGIEVTNGGTLLFNSGTIEAPYAGVYLMENAKMTLNGGTVDSFYGLVTRKPGASLTVTTGTITADGFAISGNGSVGQAPTSITIDGGNITSTNSVAIYHPQDGNLTITAGTISGYNGIEMKAGNLSVTGGTILGTGAYLDPLPNDNGSANTGDAILLNGRDAYTGDITLNITGGTITSTNAYALRDYKAADQAHKTSLVAISGGEFRGGAGKEAVTFSDETKALAWTDTTGLKITNGLYNIDPAAFVFSPLRTYVTGSGMYGIQAIPPILNVELNIEYFDLQTAVNAAAAGNTLKFQLDYTIPTTVTIDKALTLDLNGKTVTYTTTDLSYALTVGAGGALTIDDTSMAKTGLISVLDGDMDPDTDGRGIGVIAGSLTLKAGTIQAPYAGVYVRPGASMVMDSGTIGGTVDPLYGIVILGPGSSLDINGGTIEATYFAVNGNGTAGFGDTTITIDNASLTSTTGAAIYHPQNGLLTINSGTMITGPNGIEMKAGDLVITGGTITATGPCTEPTATGNGSTATGDAILIFSRDGYGTGLTMDVTISGSPVITSTNCYALREFTLTGETSRLGVAKITGGSFTGTPDAVSFTTNTDTNLDLLPGGLYNTDPKAFVYVPYGTYLDGSMYGIRLLPTISGLVTMQGRLNTRAGVPLALNATAYTDTSDDMTEVNYAFIGVELGTYTFTTDQPRYLNITATIVIDSLTNRSLPLLRLLGGDVNQDHQIGLLDANAVGGAWGSTVDSTANINFDGIVNIQDLALVGGNYGLTSATAYSGWVPFTTP